MGELLRQPDAAHRPITGFHLTDAIRAGRVGVRPGVARLTMDGARFADRSEERCDVGILATGFDAALAPLGTLVRTDAKGFAMHAGRVASADQPRLWFVGHDDDATGWLFDIAHDAPLVASAIAHELGCAT